MKKQHNTDPVKYVQEILTTGVEKMLTAATFHKCVMCYNRGCCFLVQAMLPEGFPFHSLI